MLERLSDGEFQLDIRGCDYLGEIVEHVCGEDEEGELVLPEKIDGKCVEYSEDS